MTLIAGANKSRYMPPVYATNETILYLLLLNNFNKHFYVFQSDGQIQLKFYF